MKWWNKFKKNFEKLKWIGIIIKWIFYFGKKPINQIKKESWNSRIGIIAILGHIFPIYLKFKGGKGVATTLLIIFAINFKIGLVCLVVWVVSLLLFGFSSLSSILMCLFTVLISIINFLQMGDYEFLTFSLIFSFIIIAKHKINIIRLIKKQEPKIFKKSLFR